MTSVSYSGPVFDGTAAGKFKAACVEAQNDISQEAEDLIDMWLGMHLKHPTGYYESQIQTDRSSRVNIVNDGGVIYGPWLEGVGSRNSPVTRFKGYRTFRTVAQDLRENLAEGIAEDAIAPYVEEVNR